MTDLDEIRNHWRRTQFQWGSTDCILSVCNYVHQRTGIDPAAPWRGMYQDEEGARDIYEAHGGVLSLFAFGMAQAGFDEGLPIIGAPVVADLGGHQVAGIHMGRRIMFRIDGRGVVEWPAKVLGAWKI